MGSKEKRTVIKDLVAKSKASILLLQETKMGEMDRGIIHEICPFACPYGVCIPSMGASGGIWVVWDTASIVVSAYWPETFSMSIRGCLKNASSEWVITIVYGPCDHVASQKKFLELESLRGRWTGPWCIRGDFNEVREPGDRSGANGNRRTSGMQLFLKFINAFGQREIHLAGSFYTWYNFQESPSLNKLDRFFVSADWEGEDAFPNSFGELFPKPTSNHAPILLSEKNFDGGPRPFKFENM